MAKTQSDRITALEHLLSEALSKINELTAAVQPLSTEVVRAHGRIDHAGDVFKELRIALTPKREPARIDRAQFDAALAELRSDSGNDRASFPLDVIRARAHARAALQRNTEAAGA